MIRYKFDLINNSFSKIVAGLTFLIFLFCISASGQSDKVVSGDSAVTRQKDIVDFFDKNLNIHLRKDNSKLKGNGPFFSIIPAAAYSLQSGLTGALVTNASFYADTTRNKFSNMLLSGYYSEYHQYWFICNTNVFFNKFHLFGDTRYYNFPTNT